MSIGLGILGWAHGHAGAYCGQWVGFAARTASSDGSPSEPYALRLVAGWDHDAARAAASNTKFGMATSPSAEALLKRPDIDAVVIGAETSMHADLVEQAAAAGKSIVLQKPLALTLGQADRIVSAVERYKVPFTLAWQMRADPQNLRMRQLVREGTLGRIFMLRRRHGLSTHTWPNFDTSWHVQPALNRGMWADDASHAIDFIYWMLGLPASVSAEVETLHNPKVPDDNGIAIFRYANGTLAEVASSFVCLAGENTTEIVGERGVVIQNYGDAVSCGPARPAGAAGLKWMLKDQKGWTDSGIPSPAAHSERITGLARPILDFLRGQRGPLATAAEGRNVLRMTLACYQSAREGRRIAMTDVHD